MPSTTKSILDAPRSRKSVAAIRAAKFGAFFSECGIPAMEIPTLFIIADKRSDVEEANLLKKSYITYYYYYKNHENVNSVR